MPKSENQKQKLLHIAQYLMENTDEKHAVSTPQLIEYLNSQGIKAERKSIYNDIDTLNDFGMDIIRSEEHRGGYMLASRPFELAEVKLLVDLVQSSKFITEKKSRELITKLETLTSKYDAKAMRRQVEIIGRSKTLNETIYYNVDMVHTAISQNVKIRFHYFDWDVNKKMKLRHDGAWYEVSPWRLTWDDENYYLMAFDEKANEIRFYRVDKIVDIALTQEAREGKESFEHLDMAEFSKKTFGMFAGEEKTVRLRCENSLTGVIIDTFGTDIALRPDGDNHFIARAEVVVSSQFFGWLAGLGPRVEIISPDEVRSEYIAYLTNIMSRYEI
ncbi:MAG: WYL domain-containing protein [Agathobacter sp.]|nr:WYL domain-containing protein [Agathobacter sp.]